MIRAALYLAGLAFAAPALADAGLIARGEYIATIAGCNDCHTPGALLGAPDMARRLGGSDVGFEITGAGTFYGPNLTPDRETGLGGWTDAEVKKAIANGIRPDGRELSGVMPWPALSQLTDEDMGALVAFLRSLPPVHNKAPGPLKPGEKATGYVSKIVPAQQ
jgi:mono/diheme cytochrome c family protein